MEQGGDNAWYDTARFYNPSGNYVEAALRTLNEAERSSMFAHDWQALNTEARALGIDVTDLEEHDALVNERDLLAAAWKRQRFVVAEGLQWMQENARGASQGVTA